MRKSRKETAETRERIVKVASEEFRRNGIEQTGLTDLMAAAGMTQGGFYKHFESKEQIVRESIVFGAESMLDSWQRNVSSERGEQGLRDAIAEYLSSAHRDDPGSGCPFAALASDMARGGDAVRAAATDGFLRMVNLIADQLPNMSHTAARKEALWIFNSMIGSVIMSRVVNDKAMSDTILREARKHLLSAAV